MYRWYKNAQICYIYLSDVEKSANQQDTVHQIHQSRWFTRGWTLQELLAPRVASFHAEDWSNLGTKTELVDTIHVITGIDKSYLNGEDLQRASVAQRMSWASSRNTSRTEDIAYCLLGIFDINLPLIYGEGRKAFQRLQEAIMQSCPDDHSLFAWGTIVDYPPLEELTDDDLSAYNPPAWKPPAQRLHDMQLSGLLASSPRDFRDSHSIVPSECAKSFYRNPDIWAAIPIRVGGGGNGIIRLDLPFLPVTRFIKHHWDTPNFAQARQARFPVLLCHYKGRSARNYMILTIIECNDHLFSRCQYLALSDKRFRNENIWPYQLTRWKRETVIGLDPFPLRGSDIIFRRQVFLFPPDSITWRPHHGGYCSFNNSIRVYRGVDSPGRGFAIEFRRKVARGKPAGFCILFTRASASTTNRVHETGEDEDEKEEEKKTLQDTTTITGGGSGSGPLMLGLVPFSSISRHAEVDESRNSVDWPLLHQVRAATPEYIKVLESPMDGWTVPLSLPFHEAYVGVERVSLGGSDESFADVVDLIVK